MFSLDGEALAAIWGGAVGAILGGVISLGIQLLVLRQAKMDRIEQQKEERRALARSLFLKMIRIASNLDQLQRHLELAFATVPNEIHENPWLFVQPLASLPPEVQIASHELSLVMSFGDDELLNKLLPFDAIHNDTVALFHTFARLKNELKPLMPATIEGSVATTVLSEERMKLVAPRAAELNMLLKQMRERLKLDLDEARWIVDRLHPALSKHADMKLGFAFK